jgi:hypothetical protein
MTKRHDKALFEARTAHRNLPVRHPNRWKIIAELLFSPPARLHHYRDLNRRMVDKMIETVDGEARCR